MAAILDQLDLVSQILEATITFYRLLGAKISGICDMGHRKHGHTM